MKLLNVFSKTSFTNSNGPFEEWNICNDLTTRWESPKITCMKQRKWKRHKTAFTTMNNDGRLNKFLDSWERIMYIDECIKILNAK